MPKKPTIPHVCAHCGVDFLAFPWNLGKYCSAACQNLGKMVDPAVRFWPKVNKDGPTIRPELGPCWVWIGATMPDGRGQFHYEGRTEYAATVAYILTHGPLPADRPWVLHHCDGGRLCCVRPDHLFAGTHAENMADMVAKGRHSGNTWIKANPERVARGERHGSRTHPEAFLKKPRHQ